VVTTWDQLVDSINNLVFHLSHQVRTIARAAGDEIAGPRQLTPLDVLAQLTEWTAYNAGRRDESTVLIELRNRAARLFFDSDDFCRAQEQWEQALEHADQLAAAASYPTTASNAHAAATRILETRSDLAHARNRLGDAIDIETRLLDRHRYADDRPAVARALTRLGATMAAAQQYDRAEEYLTEAEATFRAFDPHDPDGGSRHADNLDLLATVLDHRGRHAEADQRRQQAEGLRNRAAHPAGQP
jgi:tetratricopeptide (TPR) repeat protein